MKLSQDGHWAAVMEARRERPFLRVWALAPDHSLADQLPDPCPAGFVAWDFTWCGNLLVFGALPDPPPGNGLEDALEAPGGRTIAWDPESRSAVGELPETFMGLLGDQTGRRLVGFGAIASLLATPSRNILKIIDVPIMGVAATIEHPAPMLAEWLSPSHRPVCWHPELDGWFMVWHEDSGGRQETGLGSGRQFTVGFCDTDGHIERIGRLMKPWLAASSELPAAVPVRDGRAVAGLAEAATGRDSVAVFAPAGPSDQYALSAYGRGIGCPRGLTQVAPHWRYVTCAPDGRRALFQEIEGTTDHSASAGRLRVWVWDLKTDAGRPVAATGRIEQCYGWASDDSALVKVATVEGGRSGTEAAGWSIGVLTVPVGD